MRYATLLLVALVLLGCQTVSSISVDPKAEVSSAAKAWEAAVNRPIAVMLQRFRPYTQMERFCGEQRALR